MKHLLAVFACLLTLLTVSAQEQSPVVEPGTMSPDGTMVTFKVVLPEVIASYAGDFPGTVGLYDTDRGVITIIGAQSEDFRCDSNSCSTGTTQGRPVFSPDGAQIAWGEFIEGTAMDLVIYTIATGETVRYEASIPIGFQDAGLRIPDLQWGSGGIISLIGTFFSDGTAHFILPVINPLTGDNRIIDIYRFNMDPAATPEPMPAVFEWIEGEDGVARLLVGYFTGDWKVIDFDAQTITPVSAAPSAEVALFGEETPIGTMTYTFNPDAMTTDRIVDSTEYGDEMGETLLLLADDIRLKLFGMAFDVLQSYVGTLVEMSEGETLSEETLIFEDTRLVEPLAPEFRWMLDSEPDGEPAPLIIVATDVLMR